MHKLCFKVLNGQIPIRHYCIWLLYTSEQNFICTRLFVTCFVHQMMKNNLFFYRLLEITDESYLEFMSLFLLVNKDFDIEKQD